MEKNQLEEDIRTSGCFEELAIKASLCGCFEVNELVKRIIISFVKTYNDEVRDKAKAMMDEMGEENRDDFVNYGMMEELFNLLRFDARNGLGNGNMVERITHVLEKVHKYDDRFIKNLHDKNGNNILMLLGEWHDLKRRTECLTKIRSNVKYRVHLEDIFIRGTMVPELIRKLIEWGVDEYEKNNDGLCFHTILNGFSTDKKYENDKIEVI